MKIPVHRLFLLFLTFAFGMPGVVAEDATLPVAKIERSTPVDFEKEILPFLRKNCLACHNESKAKGDVVLETPKIIRDDHDEPIVIPGEAEESLLFKVASHAEKPYMPPPRNKVGAGALSPEELSLLKLWIDEGAKGDVRGASGRVEWYRLSPAVHPVYGVCFAPDGRSLFCSRANQIFVYDLDDGRLLQRLTDPSLLHGIYEGPGVAHLDEVQALAIAPGGRLLASGGFGCVKLWTRGASERRSSLKLGAGGTTAFAVSPDGSRYASGTPEGTVRTWKAGQAEPEHTLEGHEGRVTGLRFSPDGARLLSASEDRTIGVWDVVSGARLLRLETGAPLRDAVFIAGGAGVAAAGADGRVLLWTLSSTEDRLSAHAGSPLAGHSQAVTALAVVPTAPHQIVSAGAGGELIHWDTASGRELRRMKHGAPITAIAVRPDGREVASCGQDATLRLWDLPAGKEVATVRGEAWARHRAAVARQRSKLNAEVLAAARKNLGGAEKAVKKAEEGSKKAADALAAAEKTLAEKRTDAEAAENATEKDKKKIEAARKKLAAAEKGREEALKKVEDAKLELRRGTEALELAKREKVESEAANQAALAAVEKMTNELERTAAPIRDVAFSGGGRRLAAVDAKGVVHVVGASKGTPVSTIESGSADLSHVAFAASGEVLGVAADGNLFTWDAAPTWELLGRIDASVSIAEGRPPFTGRVTALAFSPDGSLLATGDGEPSRSGHLKVWKVDDRSLLWAIEDAHSDTLSAIEFSYDGKFIATGGTDKFVRVFSVEEGKLIRSLEGHTGHVLGVSWQADGRTLASCGADNVVKVWDVDTGEQRQTIGGYEKQVTAIRFVGIGGEAISCAGDRTVRRHQVANRRQVRTYGGATAYLHCLATTPDGSLVAAGDQSGGVRVWNADDGKLLLTLEPPK